MAIKCIYALSVATLVGSESSDGIFSSLFGASSSTLTSDTPWAPPIVFHDKGHRDLEVLDLPVKACTSHSLPAPFWKRAFLSTRLRLAPDSWPAPRWSTRPTFLLRQQLPQRGFCKWLSMAGMPVSLLCEDCSKRPCVKAAGSVPGFPDFAAELPPDGEACVWLEQLPVGAKKITVSWEQHVDHWVLGRLILGSMLVWFHRSLRESTALHAAMGGVGSLGVVLIFVCWWFVSSTKNTISSSVPLGGLFTSMAGLGFVMMPAVREALVSLVRPASSSDLAAWLNLRDPAFNLPIGWIILVSALTLFVTTIVWGARYSVQFFTSPPEPDGVVDFTIGNDGRRIDILPPTPLCQQCLGWLIWLLGLIQLLQSTYSDTYSLALTLLILGKDMLIRVAAQRLQGFLGGEFEPGALRPLVSTEVFEEQGKRHTAMALAKLQRHLQGDMSGMGRVREDTELRIRRFSDGCGHYHHPTDLALVPESRGWGCCVL